MDFELKKINQALRKYDRDLYALREPVGVINVFRQGRRIDDSMIPDCLEYLEILRPNPQYLFSLTNNWNLNGTPVEWGLEPIMYKIREMDSWSHEISLDDMRRKREWADREAERIRVNEFKAVASELRRPFAKITNDYLVRSKINVNR